MSLPTPPPRRFLPEPEPIDEADFMVIMFRREDVEQLHTGAAAVQLLTLVDQPERAARCAHRLVFAFEGYDDDARELPQIPQACDFMRALHEVFPWWLHFLAPQPDLWAVLLRLLLSHPTADGQVRPVGAEEGRQLVQAMCQPMNVLHEHCQLPTPRAQEIFNTSVAAIQGALK